METITIMALIFFLLVAVAVYATVKAVKAAKRGVDRTIDQARRSVEDTALRARTFARPGPAGEAAQLRLTLRTSMRVTQDALAARRAEDASLKETAALFDRLSSHGHQLDDELRRLEQDPDRDEIARRLPALRRRTEQITEAATSLRSALRDRAHHDSEDDLGELAEQIRVESGALRHWTAEPAPAAHQKPEPWPEPERTEGGTPMQTWPETPGSHTAPTPTAIDPATQRTPYPWERQRRRDAERER
ncbi:hypothetical protein [Streptomyces sp. BBFR102]|uniref:hypothetical protein n=1 Tax=Streptomyces sp. BBFR102 TaxID=3448171 RepID=UPI003F532F57